jgi:hypothetical protein
MPSALWNADCTVRLSLAREKSDNAGAYSAAEALAVADSLTCQAIRLDDYVARAHLTRVDFMKIDVEGAELFTLEGAASVVERHRPTMLVEIDRGLCSKLGYTPEQTWEFLKPFGYRIWEIGQSPESSRPLQSLTGVSRSNVIFHTDPLPGAVLQGWSLKAILRAHSRPANGRH